jgi:hypothetical protein
MKMLRSILVIALALIAIHSGHAQQTLAPSKVTSELGSRRMFIDPSSSSVSLGNAKLIVSPLVQKKETIYTGDYQLKVIPYFFKNQKGGLVLVSSGNLVGKLSQGKAVEFTGKATNTADGTSKVVRGKATPSTPDQGAVTFSILTDNGEMVFDTFYHFGT